MANLTLSIDEAVLRRARIRALERGTSVNAILREYLEAFAGTAGDHERAVRALLDIAQRTDAGRGAARWTRDELHERGGRAGP